MADYQYPDFSLTSLGAAQANTLAAVKVQVGNLNDNLRSIYLTAFSNWSQSVVAGRAENSNPPIPPKGYTIMTSPEGWAYPGQGNDLVCDMPPIPEVPKPYTPPVLPEPVNIRNVPVGDIMPAGYLLTAPDGTRWQKHATPTPFGVAYYYARVA